MPPLVPVSPDSANLDLATRNQMVIYLHDAARVLSLRLDQDQIGQKLRVLADELSASHS